MIKNENALSGLTQREQEILVLFLDGLSFKEIASKLCVSYKTIDFHRGNIYRKFGIQSMQELMILFSNKEIPESILETELNINFPKEFIPTVYKNWITLNDKSSSVELVIKSKGIYILSANQGKESGFAGVFGIPDNNTIKTMKSMSMFSFKVLGDGNDYLVMLPTAETEDNGYHFCKKFSTDKGKMTTIIVDMKNDLTQWNWGGIPKEFIPDNITGLQFLTVNKGNSNLMFWDIKLYK